MIIVISMFLLFFNRIGIPRIPLFVLAKLLIFISRITFSQSPVTQSITCTHSISLFQSTVQLGPLLSKHHVAHSVRPYISRNISKQYVHVSRNYCSFTRPFEFFAQVVDEDVLSVVAKAR